jgi:hypothetical protein
MTKRTSLAALIALLAPMTAAPTCSDKEVPIGEAAPGSDAQYESWGYCIGMSGYSNCEANQMFGSEDTENCDANCTCVLPCRSASECPVPDTGTAVPACGHLGTEDSDPACILPCGDDEVCPDGMSCQSDLSPEGPICVWHQDGDLNLRCNPDGCEQFTNQADCEAAADSLPDGYELTCAWATELIVPGSSADCTSVHAEKKCVAAQHEPDNDFLCENTAPCGDQPQVIYWQDLGGGDLSLLALDGCALYPYTHTGDYEVCDYGDPILPQNCACACDEPL